MAFIKRKALAFLNHQNTVKMKLLVFFTLPLAVELALPKIYDTSWFDDYSPETDFLRPPPEVDKAFTASKGGAVPKEQYRLVQFSIT